MQTTTFFWDLKTIFVSILAAAFGFFLVILLQYYQPKNRAVSATPVTVENSLSMEQLTPISQISSDGTKMLSRKITGDENGTKILTLSTNDSAGTNKLTVFTKILDSNQSVIIPFNTWSPDNKYFFVLERGTGEDRVMVFKGSGDIFDNGGKYLDLTAAFKNYNSPNNFSEATGWASETLIIFNTTTPDNTKGPSFWFEVPTKAIYSLGTQF